MPTQADFKSPRKYPLCQISDKDGELKTRNVPSNQVQRPVITDRDDSMFTASVEFVTCVHGQLSPQNPTPASLIIFEYKIFCKEPDHVVNSLRTTWHFAQNQPGSPKVQAFGPYLRRIYQNSTSNITNTVGIEGTVGAEFAPAKADIKLSAQRETSHEQRYFEKMESSRKFNQEEQRHDEVWWKLTQNQSQKGGITPAFRTAVLLERPDLSQFTATFDIKIDGGFRYAASKSFKKLTGRTLPDDPVIFDPTAQALGSIKPPIDSTRLGQYATENKLDDNLTFIWGVDIGE